MTATPSKSLPDDVVIDILSRLPVKTLIRLRCVCKSWNATISHPSFIKMHLHRPCLGYLLQCVRLWDFGKYEWFLVCRQADGNHVGLKEFKWFIIAGTFKGLLCLSDSTVKFGRTIYLWNPSIRKSKTLPSSSSTFPPLQFFNSSNPVVLGFCFHHQSNDFKVVRILYFRDPKTYIEEAPAQVEVYTLSTDSWRRIEALVPSGLPRLKDDQVSTAFLNGSVHWVASKPVGYRENNMIMSFDMGEEVFREMMLPNYRTDGVRVAISDLLLAVSKELLYLCVCFRESGHCDLWIMREYGVVESWTKQSTIVLRRGRVEKCLGFTKNNELLLQTSSQMLVSYDLESRKPKSLGIRGTRYTSNVDSVVPLTETLVLLEGENTLLRQENSFDEVSGEGIEKVKSRMQLSKRG